MAAPQIMVITHGSTDTTHVYVDGEELDCITKISFEIDLKNRPKLILEIDNFYTSTSLPARFCEIYPLNMYRGMK